VCVISEKNGLASFLKKWTGIIIIIIIIIMQLTIN